MEYLRTCPICYRRVRPIVRDDLGPKCPICGFRFRRSGAKVYEE